MGWAQWLLTFVVAWFAGTWVLMGAVPHIGWPVSLIIVLLMNIVFWAVSYAIAE